MPQEDKLDQAAEINPKPSNILKNDYYLLYGNLMSLKKQFDRMKPDLPKTENFDWIGQVSRAIDYSINYVDKNKRSQSYEDRIISMVNAFRYVAEIYPLQIPVLFIGYQAGEKNFRGSYIAETNTEDYCRRMEPLILRLIGHQSLDDDLDIREDYACLVAYQKRFFGIPD